MEYAYKINSPIWQDWPLTRNFKYEGSLSVTGLAMVDKSFVRPDLLDEASRIGLDIKYAAIFYTKPGKAQGIIHLDQTTQPYRQGIDRCAVNWSVTDADWAMNYFKPLAGKVDDNITVTGNNYEEVVVESQTEPYSFSKFNPSEMELIHSVSWKVNPVLVRTDIPHNLEIKSPASLHPAPGGKLMLQGHRWCASVRFADDDFDYVKKILSQHYG
jgi:hypothetical protein